MVVNPKKNSFSLSNIFSFRPFSEKRILSLQKSLIESIGNAEEFSHSLIRVRTQKQKIFAVKEAHQHVKELRKNLKQALASTKYLRNNGRGEIKKYNFFDYLYGSCGLILSMTEQISVPHSKSLQWKDKIEEIEEKVGSEGIIGQCSEMIDLLEAYTSRESFK